ncbi:hypothetical protein Tco_1548169 [Tanacetum coccineum]
MEESLSKFMTESAKRHEENSNIIKEIRASTDAAIRNQGASIKTFELQIVQMSKVLQERGFGSLHSSKKTNLKDQVKSISTARADLSEIHRVETSLYVVSLPQHKCIFPKTLPFPWRLHNYYCDDLKEAHEVKILDTIDQNLPQKEKDPGSFTLPCFINNVCFNKALVDLGASVNYGVTCEDEAKRRNSGTKTKTFEENCYLLLYAVSSKEDTAYQRQLITRIRVIINSRSGVSLFTYTPYVQLVISQRYEVNVIDGN